MPKLHSFILTQFLGALVSSGVAFAGIDFESAEGFAVGQDASKAPGWFATGGKALITDHDAHSGTQSLEINANATATYSISATPWPSAERIAWVDFWIKPQADTSTEPLTTLDADGSRLAFVKQGSRGMIYAYSPDGKGNGESLSSGTFFLLDAAGRSAKWIRVTLRQDFQGQTWDLFLDGRPVLGNLRMDNATPKATPSCFTLGSPTDGATLLDTWNLASSNPLFADADNDGIPDTFERAFGYDPYVSNRAGNLDSTGALEFQKFLESVRRTQGIAGSMPANDGRFIYVDQTAGNDSNTGLLCYRSEGTGPKATIRAAMAAAGKGDTIIVNEGVYQEGTISLIGKPFNLKTVGTVKF
jgi:hypothetical protein